LATAFLAGALRAAAFLGAAFLRVAALRFAGAFFFAVAIFIFSGWLTCHARAKITTKTKRYKQTCSNFRPPASEHGANLTAKNSGYRLAETQWQADIYLKYSVFRVFWQQGRAQHTIRKL
ncbi:MAG: hypothetical protein KDI04_14615, partial [Halieaceae bacterium]|nr:hypothetical protein [Halieaceae bacterium]